MKNDKILAQLDILGSWFEKHNYKGYDIYDLYDNPFFHWLITNKPVLIRKVNRKVLSILIKLFPKQIISIFKKKKNINPKAMGLLLKGYCNLYRIYSEERYLNKAKEIADWLLNNKSEGIFGVGWGYPFDWSGSKMIPKYTPSSVVSTICGDGLYELYLITSNEKYLENCKGICNFIINDLNIDHVDDDSLCFSYTPIDNNHVNNANLFAAEYLIRIGKKTTNMEYIEFGTKAVNYTLRQQSENGSILYWGNEDKKRLKFSFSNLDHYHTGFELRMLWKLFQHLNEKRIEDAFKAYSSFYYSNFFHDYKPLIRPNKLYPINIHGCAEAILCNSIINNGLILKNEWFSKMIDWINNTMRDNDNLYIYEINSFLGIKIKTKFKFHRWAQAWMFLAFTEYLVARSKNEKK